jgi:hypothetical protein
MRPNYPLCGRTIDAISDYGLIYVAKFKRVGIPGIISFPDYSDNICGLVSRKGAKQIILAHLEPYFDKLEALVGKEVPTEQVLPPFGDSRFGLFRFPETRYNLALQEYDSESTHDRLAFKGFPLKDLETPQHTRKIAFVINRIYGISDVYLFATVGGMSYEGRK